MKQNKKINISRVSLKIDTNNNKLLSQVVSRINKNDEIKTLWKIMNVMAIDRLGMSDHGPTHFQIVANNGLKIARILNKSKVEMSITKDFGLGYDYAETVVFLGCIMHDLGISIHRTGHEEYSLFMARDFLKSILDFLPVVERTVVTSEVLHAIISHRANGKPETLEAGIVRMADAIDMGKGRSRITYGKGELNIYSESDLAISDVEIAEGDNRFVDVKIKMTNPAGVFQVDDIMSEKLKGSNLEKYLGITVYMKKDGQEKLNKSFRL